MSPSPAPPQTLLPFLVAHANSHPASFHMPGHKGGRLYRRFGYGRFLDCLADADVTEIPGADNLFQAEGIIRATEERYARLYGAERSYLLVNGSSGGLIAAILSAVPEGGRLILARDCHKSIFTALRLGRIQPVYAYPDRIEPYGIAGGISVAEIERCLWEAPEAAAVVLPSPNYYGVCSDLAQIAECVHAAGKVLIVDQAHGAHLKFFEAGRGRSPGKPLSAEAAGADLIVNSIHKTLASFTQSALLNCCSNRVERDILEDRLQMLQTTSPSYLLMASLDINADLLERHGQALIGEWQANLERFYRAAEAIPGLTALSAIDRLDRSKINLDAAGWGMSGAELEEQLIERGVYPELTTGSILMLMTGIGNEAEHYDRLLVALTAISAERREALRNAMPDGRVGEKARFLPPEVNERETLATIPAKIRRVPLVEAAGQVCALSIVPYPPGIPLICPGERISRAAIEQILALRQRGEKVIGINERNEVAVGEDDMI